uniref:DUF4939 domain-containing protein n=1 Tax=Moniliophthora roreri TaxID=221103 RepID=A0A0W0F9T1_MONRR
MSGEGSKPLGSRLKKEESTVVASTVTKEEEDSGREIKAMLPTPFTEDRKDMKKFMQKVQLYVALNLKAFKKDKLKELFMLSYIQGGPTQFWKSEKPDALLAEENPKKISAWKDFLKNFKESFEPLDVELDA